MNGYVTRAYVADLTGRLAPRDWAILDTLGRLRVATAVQLEHLHFGDVKPSARPRIRRRVLARLTEQRVLARLERRIGGVRAGSAGYVYTLGVAGQRLIRGVGPRGGRVRRPSDPSPPFLSHQLGVTEAYVRLVTATRTADAERELEIARFEAEPVAWRRFLGPAGERRVLKPDADVVIHGRDLLGERYADHLFLEFDRGTEGPRQLRRQADAYWNHYRSGAEQTALGGVYPRVVWTSTEPERCAWLVDVLSRQRPEAWRLHQVIPLDRLAAVLLGEDGAAASEEGQNEGRRR